MQQRLLCDVLRGAGGAAACWPSRARDGKDSAFNQYLVKPGFLAVHFDKAFSLELNRRILPDYEEGGVTPDGAAEAIANAREFVAAVSALIAGPSPE